MEQINKTDESILESALKNTPLRDRPELKGKLNEFFDELVRNFLEEKVRDFPKILAETRRVNNLHLKELEENGVRSPLVSMNGGTYGGTTGWSKDLSFKFKWIIPKSLEFFMRNLIYKDFWEDSNKKVRDSFMKAVLRGDDSFELLKKVRSYYGDSPNKVETMEVVV